MADYLQEHLEILKLAVENKLGDRIDETSGFSLEVVRELVDDGFLKAIPTKTINAPPQFLEPSITIPGREYLIKLEERKREKSFIGRLGKFFPKFFGWVFGILGAIIASLVIAWLVKIIFGSTS